MLWVCMGKKPTFRHSGRAGNPGSVAGQFAADGGLMDAQVPGDGRLRCAGCRERLNMASSRMGELAAVHGLFPFVCDWLPGIGFALVTVFQTSCSS